MNATTHRVDNRTRATYERAHDACKKGRNVIPSPTSHCSLYFFVIHVLCATHLLVPLPSPFQRCPLYTRFRLAPGWGVKDVHDHRAPCRRQCPMAKGRACRPPPLALCGASGRARGMGNASLLPLYMVRRSLHTAWVQYYSVLLLLLLLLLFLGIVTSCLLQCHHLVTDLRIARCVPASLQIQELQQPVVMLWRG